MFCLLFIYYFIGLRDVGFNDYDDYHIDDGADDASAGNTNNARRECIKLTNVDLNHHNCVTLDSPLC